MNKKQLKLQQKVNPNYIPNDLFGTTKVLVMKQCADYRQRVLRNPSINESNMGEIIAFKLDDYFSLGIGFKVYFYDDERYGSYYPFWLMESSIFSNGKGNMKVVEFSLLPTFYKNQVDIALKLALGECGVKEDKLIRPKVSQVAWHTPFKKEEILLLPEVFQGLVRIK